MTLRLNVLPRIRILMTSLPWSLILIFLKLTFPVKENKIDEDCIDFSKNSMLTLSCKYFC